MRLRKVKLFTNSRMVLLVAASALFSCSGGVDDQQSVEAAKQYLEKNQLREAGLELKSALQSNAENAEARYLLGQLNLTVGDMEAAAKEFRKATRAGWDEAQAQTGLMQSLIKRHDYVEVINVIQIKEHYSDRARADLIGLKAFSLAATGDIEQAEQLIMQAEALDADSFQLLKTSVQINLIINTDDSRSKADELLEKALSIYENNVELLLLKAYAARQSQDNDTAVEQFRKIIALEPEELVTFDGRSARLELARIEVLNKDFELAGKTLAPLFKQSPNDPETNYIGALLSFEQAVFDLAEERLLKVFNVVPEHVKSQLLFGAVNFAQKDYEQASYYLGKYLKFEPGNVGARKLLGRTLILMGQHEEAKVALKSGLKDGDAELLALVGLSQLKSGDTAAGLRDLKKAVAAAPGSQSIRGELAKAYISAGETEKAIKQLNMILAEGGNKNQTEMLMVVAYLRDEQFDQAINTALELLERSPQDSSILLMVGNVFAASGDRDEARKYFSRARETDPNNVRAIMLLAALEEIEGNLDQAVALYRGIDAKKTSSVDHLLALARLAGKQGDNQTMVKWLEMARQKLSTDIRSRLVLAEHYLRAKELAKVEALVKEVVGISPNDPRVLVIQGKVLMVQERFNEALGPLNKLVTRESKAILGRILLGEAYMHLDQAKDARRQLELALKINEFELPALLLIANVELKEGQYEKALKYSRKAQKVNPDLPIGHELEGDIQVAARKYRDAKFAYNRAIQLQPSAERAIKLSGALIGLNRHEQARQPLLQWLDRHPDDIKVHQYLGSLYQTLGENALAIKAFETVLKANPENIVALNNLAWLYALDDNPAALEAADKVYRLLPDNPGVQDTYGWVLVKNGQVDKGRQILELALKSLPDVADVQYHYAVALAKSGETIEARKRLRELLNSQKTFTGIEDARLLLDSLQ